MPAYLRGKPDDQGHSRIRPDGASGTCRDASISLAAGLGAHLDAIAIGFVSSGAAAFVMDGSAAAAVAAVFEMEQERAAERATAALAVFEAEARHAGISYECRA